MNLNTVEDDFVSKLSAAITDVRVRSWPTDYRNYLLKHPNAAILVQYRGSQYSEADPNDEKVVVQMRTALWAFGIVEKSLKLEDGHQGVYARIESIRSALTGYTPGTQSESTLSDASVLRPVNDRFVAAGNGFWIYESLFQFDFPESEA